MYYIRNELKKDISKTEVEETINRHQTTFIKRIETENGINLMVHLGMADSISLVLAFSNEKLKTAILIGEDSPQDVPQDAPSNIE